jgi:hypothetical protein
MMRHGIHQVCPGVVNSLGTPPSAEVQDAVDRMTYLNDHPEAVDRMTYLNDHPMVTRHLKPPVGGRVKPHEMLQRDSESPVPQIKILMESGDYISPDCDPGNRTRCV